MKKKIFCMLMSLLLIIAMMPNTLVYAADKPILQVKSATTECNPEETIDVDIEITNNVGITTGSINIKFNKDSFKLIGVKNTGNILDAPYVGYTKFPITTGEYTLSWDGGLIKENSTKNGVIATLQFAVLETATVGEHDITISSTDLANATPETVETEMKSGKVTLRKTITTPIALAGTLTTPTKGAVDATVLTGEHVNANVTWTPALEEGNKFAANTKYTATITVTPEQYYSFGNGANITYAGLTFEKSGGNFVATKTFPATASKSVTALEVTQKPTKTAYTHGDKLDTKGMVVKATFDDGSEEANYTGYTVVYQTEGKAYLKKGDTTVTLKAEKQTTQVTDLTVKAKELEITELTAVDRDYEEGNTTVALTGGELVGVIEGENVTVTMPTEGKVADANAAELKPVTVEKPTLEGADAGNYTLKDISDVVVTIESAPIPADVKAAITPYGGEAGAAYDGNAHDVVTVDASKTAGYDIKYAPAADADATGTCPTIKDAGTQSVWVVVSRTNYITTKIQYLVTVNQKVLTAEDFDTTAAQTKAYDTTTAYTSLTSVAPKAASVFNETGITVNGTAAFDSANAGSRTLTFTPAALTGDAAKNYKLADDLTLVFSNASITKAGEDTYDTTEAYTKQNVVVGIGTFAEPKFVSTFNEVVNGTFTFSYDGATTKEDIQAKLAALTTEATGVKIGYTFAPAADGNYEGTKTGEIAVTMIDIEFKVGDEAASVDNAVTVKNNAPVYGTKWSDIVALKNNITANVGETAVEGTYTLDVDGNAIPDAGTATYKVLFTSKDGKYTDVEVLTSTVTVSQKPLTVVGAKAATRQYDATTAVEVTGGELNGVLAKDAENVTLGGTVTGTIADANVGAKKAVTVAGYEITGTASANYTLSQPTDVTVDITKKELTIASAAVDAKSYDGTTKATVTAVIFNEVAPLPDAAGYAATAEFADAAVGNDKDVTVKVVLNDKNYNLAVNTTTVKANITKAAAVTIPTQKIVLKAGDKNDQTVDLAKFMPKDAGTVVLEEDFEVTDKNDILKEMDANYGKFFFMLDEGATAGQKATVEFTLKSDNYTETTVLIEVAVTDLEVPAVEVKDINVEYAPELNLTPKGTSDVEGTFAWSAGVTAPTTVARSGNYEVTFTPKDTEKYATVTKLIKVTITPAKVTGTLEFRKVTTAGTTLGDIKPTDFTKLSQQGTFTWNDGDAQAIEQGKAYGWTFTPTDENYAPLTGTVTPWAKSSGGSSGGSASVVTTPEKTAKDFVKSNMTANSSIIKNVDKDNYKQVLDAAEKYDKLSTAEKAAVDKEMKAQTGKTMAELKAEAEAIKASIGASTFDVQKAVKELTLKARSAKMKSGNIKITLKGDISEFEKNGYTVKYKFYRSTKKAKGYKATVTKDAPNYLNTVGKKGKMYYYKARVMVYDKDGSLVAKTELKQCKYANRKWTKK